MVRQKKTKAENYEKHVTNLLEFITNTYVPVRNEEALSFTKMTAPFDDEELYQIKPHHLAQQLALLAYGTTHPTAEMKPLHRRSDGLRFVKKAVSFFMPNKELQWNPQMKQGNPTRSVAVNEVISEVSLREVRKEGKKTNAKRDLKRA